MYSMLLYKWILKYDDLVYSKMDFYVIEKGLHPGVFFQFRAHILEHREFYSLTTGTLGTAGEFV